MATPEETRFRIKEMRERIFKEGDKDSFEKDIKESPAQALSPQKEEIAKASELAINKSEIIQKNDPSAGSKKQVEALNKSYSDKLHNSDNKVSELSTEIQNKFSELTVNTALKEQLDELDSSLKLDINSFSKNLSAENEALKEQLKILDQSLQLEKTAFAQGLSSLDEKIEAKFKDSTEEFSQFEKSIEEKYNSIDESFSEKLQKSDYKISELSADTEKKISELTLDFEFKNSNLETTLFDKIEYTVTENNSKIAGVENLVHDSTNISDKENKALKKRLHEFGQSLQLDISSISQKLSSLDEKIEAKFKDSTEEFSQFEKSIEEKYNSIDESFSEKLQKSDYKISELSADTEKKISELTLDFELKNSNLETTLFDKIEYTVAENNSAIVGMETLLKEAIKSTNQENKALKERLHELDRSLKLDINSIAQKFFTADEALQEQLNEFNQSHKSDISSVTQKFSSLNEKIKAEFKNSADNLSKFGKSFEERYESMDANFSEKLEKVETRASEVTADTQKKISELILDFENKNETLETTFFNKLEYISVHLKKLEEQIENQIGYLNTSLRGYVLSITSSQDEKIDSLTQEVNFLQDKFQTEISGIKSLVLEQKPFLEDTMATHALASNKRIDAKADKIQESVKSLKQEIFEYQRNSKTDFDKSIQGSELKTNNFLSNKISEVRELLSGELKFLSGELTVLNDLVKENYSELTQQVENNVSNISVAVEKDRTYFNNQFGKVAEDIKMVESMILKEEDLTDLFQNYTLNVNISDLANSSKS